ncbi:MAG: 4a-hydroxytetrahydrobiopterin dehydratase [Ignavibacteria bacterium]|nr:4a-hydroxytetrahydrobiopterin dehydratase [Ignavibacteria bacterium]
MDLKQLTKELENLPDWKIENNHLKKVFKTKNFAHTLALLTAIGALCQQFDHHPDYILLKYSELEISFSTHSTKSITEKDINIAREIENLGIA